MGSGTVGYGEGGFRYRGVGDGPTCGKRWARASFAASTGLAIRSEGCGTIRVRLTAVMWSSPQSGAGSLSNVTSRGSTAPGSTSARCSSRASRPRTVSPAASSPSGGGESAPRAARRRVTPINVRGNDDKQRAGGPPARPDNSAPRGP